MTGTEPKATANSPQDEMYREAARTYGPALERLARAYEADPDRRLDLLQEIHLAFWQSLASFDARCSLRTWMYRVAHNVAASHVIRDRRRNSRILVSLDEIEHFTGINDNGLVLDERHVLEKLLRLVQQLKPLERQVIVSYLEGMDAASIGEITGLSPGNVATKIHRIKNVLTRQFHRGGSHAE